MIVIQPAFKLEDGMYVLNVGDAVYDFSVGASPQALPSERFNLVFGADGTVKQSAYQPVPLPDSIVPIPVQHVDPSVDQFCVGYLYILENRVRFSAAAAVHSEGHGFEVGCGEITEAKLNKMYGSRYGAFHINFGKSNYNFIAATSDTVVAGGKTVAGVEPPAITINLSSSSVKALRDSVLGLVQACQDRQAR
jgi:hypothetical protein